MEQARLDQERLLKVANDTTDLNLQNQAKTLEAQIQEYASTLGKFQSDVGLYSQNVNKAVSEYSTNLQRDTQTLGGYTNLVIQLRKELEEFLKAI